MKQNLAMYSNQATLLFGFLSLNMSRIEVSNIANPPLVPYAVQISPVANDPQTCHGITVPA
jgi:hypothetical protein